MEDALQRVNQRIDGVLANALEPHEVAEVLQTVMQQYQGIQLLELKNLPAQAIVVDGAETGLFRHGLKMTLAGGYVDLVHYVEALESMPKQLRFTNLAYQVDQYPHAEVIIEVESLSRHEAWFGA